MATLAITPAEATADWRLESDDVAVEMIAMDDLFVDERFQRGLQEHRVMQMLNDFQPTMIGIPVVNRRPDGRYSICDGQHRHALLKMMDRTHVLCQVVAIPEREEAVLFVELQSRRRDVHPVERHRALVFAKFEEALAVDRLLKAEQFKISSNVRTVTGGVSSVRAVYFMMFGRTSTAFPPTINKSGAATGGGAAAVGDPDALRRALSTIRRSWGLDVPASRSRAIIEGSWLFHRAAMGSRFDVEHLYDRLSDKSPRALVNRAMARKKEYDETGSAQTLVAREIAATYNVGKRGAARVDARVFGKASK